MDQDLPILDETVVSLPQDLREDLALRCVSDLYVFSKSILGYRDMTPRAHGPMCVFLDHNPKHIKGCGMPRDTFKTSIGTIARNLQGVVKDRNRTRLIANESATNAQRFLRAIRQHAETNKVFRAFYSSIIPKNTRTVRWNDIELDFNRDRVVPEPTIDTVGLTGAYTSRHYDDVTFDDIISEEAAKSEKVMKDITDRARKFRALFVKPGEADQDRESTLTIMFTRWLYGDTYKILFDLIGKDELGLMIRGAIEDDGPIFPEHLSLKTLTQLRREIGEYAFSCLYMNSPRNEEIQDFNLNDLRWWRFASDERFIELLDTDGNVFKRFHWAALDITVTVDLASAEKMSDDRNAVTTCGVTPDGEIIVLESWARRCSPIVLMEYLIYLAKRWSPRAFGIEEVAYQKAFKHFLAEYAKDDAVYFNVKPIKAIKAKETRIRGLQPFAAVHKLYLSPDQHILRNELSAFPLGEHDDAADSLSMQLQLFTGQLSQRQQKKMREREKEVLAQLAYQNATLSGVRVEELDNDIDYRPAFYTSHELVEASYPYRD